MRGAPIWFVASGIDDRLYVPTTSPTTSFADVAKAALVVPISALPLGPILTADEAWTIRGAVVVFLGSLVAQPQFLPAALDEFLKSPGRGGTVAVWVANPADAPRLWRASALAAEMSTPSGGRLAGLATVAMGNFGIRMNGGSWLTVVAAHGAWRIESPPGVIEGLRFTGGWGAIGTALAGPVGIDLGPQTAGTLRFRVSLAPELETAFDVGIHYFAEEPDLPGSGLLRAPRLALTPFPEVGLSFVATIDPLGLLDPERTHLRLDPPQGTMASTLRDALGRPLALTPLEDFRLAFTESPGASSPGAGDAYCLTPVGSATLSTTPTLLPGLAASELIALPTGATTTLTFVPGGAALATALTPGRSTQPLSTRATTSWARLATSSGSACYYAQPTGAELHSLPGPGAHFMPFLPIPLGAIEPTSGFPLAPWAGDVAPDADFDARLEAGGVSPARRQTMATGGCPQSRARAAVPDLHTTAYTPQGLLAELGPDSTFAKLRLAICGNDELAMHDVGQPLLGALMTNRQFAVITNPQIVRQSFTDHGITVDEWDFSLDPSIWAAHGTMMIFKNSPRSVADLATEPQLWTDGDALNISAASASQQLTIWVAKAIAEAAKGDPGYQPIARALADPAWNGILFVNGSVPLDALPDTLSGLAPGIDGSRFFAHHLRIDTTPVIDPTAAPVDSAIFALIDYTSPGPLQPGAAAYAFQVDYLQVLIENSAVSTFTSQVTLAADQLFGAPVTADTRLLTFAGHYQKQQDAYFLALAPGESGHRFVITDATVASFTVNAGSFATVRDPAKSDGSKTGQVHGRFSLDGDLVFGLTDPQFDLFGFDVLPITGIAVDVRFNREQPRPATLTFDPTIAAIDPAGIVTRPRSLPHGFPITPKALLAGAAGQQPTDLPVLPVSVPDQWPGPTSPWYGLQFDLDLGTAGALAGSAGLVARFVLQWSPSPTGGKWAVGLGLPGATGGTTSMSIMGVLKISMYAIALTRLHAGGFMLVLEGIVLSLFSRSIPPGGAITLAIFGDPEATGPSPLAWYGAYTADHGSAVSTRTQQEAPA